MLSAAVVVCVSVFVRCDLLFSEVHLVLESRYELSTPVTAFHRVMEGASLLNNQRDPYATDYVRQDSSCCISL